MLPSTIEAQARMMTYARRFRPVFVVVFLLSTFGTVVALTGAARDGIGRLEIASFLITYCLISLGVTLGHHRLFSHRAFQTGPRMRAIFALLAHLSVQGTIAAWVAWHRQHHRHSDTDGDVHSPHCFGPGFWNRLRGLGWAHLGWLLAPAHLQPDLAQDMLHDPIVRRLDRLMPLWVALSYTLPGIVGYLVVGTYDAAVSAFLWGGPVRHFVMLNTTWAINSIAHTFGKRPFASPDRSTNVGWLALLNFGEGWHNNHHAFPRSARHGLAWWQIDLSWYVLRGLQALRLVRDVRVPSAEVQAARRV